MMTQKQDHTVNSVFNEKQRDGKKSNFCKLIIQNSKELSQSEPKFPLRVKRTNSKVNFFPCSFILFSSFLCLSEIES